MANRLLLVSGGEKGMALLQTLASGLKDAQADQAQTLAKAQEMFRTGSYELAVINPPLPDGNACALALQMAGASASGVLLLLKNGQEEKLLQKMEDAGVIVIEKPVSRPLFEQAAKASMTLRRRLLLLESSNEKLKTQLEEIRTIDRAKCTLVQVLRMTEGQAHHYIETQAMDLRQTKMQVAMDILKIYEI